MIATRTTRLAELPVNHGAREQALRLTRRISEACLRLEDPDDSEALHDFRVGVRRLRTFLRAYRGYLGIRKKTLKGLRDLTRATNGPRDNEVGIEWLEAQKAFLGRRQRVGANWILQRMDGERQAACETLRAELPLRWLRLETGLRLALGAPFADELDAGSFGAVTAGLIRQAAAELERCLGEVHAIDDEKAAHQTRIAAKKLRYLLEPLRGEVEGAEETVQQMRAFQDVFGELNDAHVMLDRLRAASELAAAERTGRLFELHLDDSAETREIRAARTQGERPGLLELARLARQRRLDLFERARGRYLEGRAAGLLEAVREVIGSLAPSDEQAPPSTESPTNATE